MELNNTPRESVDPIFARMGISKEDFKKSFSENVHKLNAAALLYGIDKLEGEVLTLIEGIGLPEKQELAIKSQFRKMYHERYRETADRLILSPLALMKFEKVQQSLMIYGGKHYNQKISGYADPE